MALAIETTGLTKRYGPARALDGLDLEVATGEVHGLLGPNGAGKTTTLRILMGLARASGGRARLLGGDPWRQRVALHRRVAYVPGDVSLWPSLTGGEVIDVLSRFRGGVYPARRAQLVERFELDPRSRMRTYSKGNRQKVVLIAALAAPVELLVLDEPTSGLDPVMEQVFQDCVREANADGRTVLLSSHILAEVESLAHRVSIVRAGRVVRSGTLTDLRGRGVTSITADVTADSSALAGLPGVRRLRRHGSTVSLQVEGTAGLDAVIGGLHRLGIQSLTSRPPTLEELFLSNLGEGDGDGDDAGDGDEDHDPDHQHDVPQGVVSWTR